MKCAFQYHIALSHCDLYLVDLLSYSQVLYLLPLLELLAQCYHQPEPDQYQG
jgi:hypothetical protein